MARRAVLGGGSSLAPFGGGQVDFGAFDIGGGSKSGGASQTVDPAQQAYLELQKVETDYQAGRVSDVQYQAALAAYAGALTPGTSTYYNAQARVEDYAYRLARDQLLSSVEQGQASWEDLLAFDKNAMAGLDQGSDEYRNRRDLYFQTQAKVFGEYEDDQIALWKSGKMTSAQLQEWYRARASDPLYTDNYQLQQLVVENIDNLTEQIQSDADAAFTAAWQKGKVTPAAFTAYATAALARYNPGTKQYQDWSELISTGRVQVQEANLNYRYDAFTRAQQLRKFIADYSVPPKGGTTSRQVWNGSDWVYVAVGTAPSKSEVAAWQAKQVDVAAAKAELAALDGQVKTVGGYVSAQTMLNFYTKQQAGLAKGSPEWYALQAKIDGYNAAAAYDKAVKGIKTSTGTVSRVTSPAAAASTKATGATTVAASRVPSGATRSSSGVSIDLFMRALASVESGGSYTAVNKSSGAYGKYQFIPSSWQAYSQKFFGTVLPQTPENQEKVARAAISANFAKYGDWEKVAQLWNPQGGQSYINKVMGKIGVFAPAFPAASAGSATVNKNGTTPAKPAAKLAPYNPAGPLRVVTDATILTKSQGAYDPQSGKTIALPSYSVRSSRIPPGQDPASFKTFYNGFMDAFEAGDTVYTDYSTGKPINYYLPQDTVALAEMVSYLDDIAVKQVASADAKAHAGVPSGPAASSAWATAIGRAAQHQYDLLVMAPGPASKPGTVGRGTYVPPTSPLAQVNPIGIADSIINEYKSYLAQQTKYAKAALDKGNVTAAWAYSQNATQAAARLEEQLNDAWIPLAQAGLRTIKTASGERPEEHVTEAMSSIVNWEERIAPELQDMETDVTSVLIGNPKNNKGGILKTDAAGNPVWVTDPVNFGRPGTVALADDTIAVIDRRGNITYKQIEGADYRPDGSLKTSEAKMVPVQVVVDGYVPDKTYAGYDIGIVGYTTDGKPLQGKIVKLNVAGKDYVAVENPLQPGRWTVGQMLVFSAPTGLTLSQSTVQGGTMYTWQGKDPNGRTREFALQWDAASEHYVVVGEDKLAGTTQVWDPTDADVAGWLQGSGFALDRGKMQRSGPMVINVDRPMIGYSDQYLTGVGQRVSNLVNNVIRGVGAAITDLLGPKLTVAQQTAIKTGTAQGYAANADRWWSDQLDWQASVPVARTPVGTPTYSEGTAVRAQPLSPITAPARTSIAPDYGGATSAEIRRPIATTTSSIGPAKTGGAPVYSPTYSGTSPGLGKPKTAAPTYGEGSAITAKPLTAPKTSTAPKAGAGASRTSPTTPARTTPTRPNTGGTAARGK